MNLSYLQDAWEVYNPQEIVKHPLLGPCLLEEYEEDFKEYKEDHYNDSDYNDEEIWREYFYDVGFSDILYHVGKMYIKKNKIPFADIFVDYEEAYDYHRITVVTVKNITKEDIEELVRLYQRQQNLPEMPELIVEQLLEEVPGQGA